MYTYNPWGIMPVRVIVPFLRTLVATSCSSRVLTSVDGRYSSDILVRCEKTHIASTQSAVDVIIERLMHSIPETHTTCKYNVHNMVHGTHSMSSLQLKLSQSSRRSGMVPVVEPSLTLSAHMYWKIISQ